jgi:putative ABC transport system ATP-binding protein
MLRDAVTSHGVTLVLVTHDMHVASYADRIVHMLDGRIQRIEAVQNATAEVLS